MSLKAVHLFFVTVFSGLAFLCAGWKLRDYFSGPGARNELLFGIGSLVVGIAVIVYGRQFLKKMKNISFL